MAGGLAMISENLRRAVSHGDSGVAGRRAGDATGQCRGGFVVVIRAESRRGGGCRRISGAGARETIRECGGLEDRYRGVAQARDRETVILTGGNEGANRERIMVRDDSEMGRRCY
jgi:hypothetical protein